MKITAINGSPKGQKSATYMMVETFLAGARHQGAETDHILLAPMKIHHCMGCFTCWTQTPKTCLFQDDMQTINLSGSDLIIYATPLFADNVSGLLKNFIDRRVAFSNPLMEWDANGEAVHPKKKKRPQIMVIANCGFPGQTHFDVLKLLFRRMARNGQTNLIAEIYRDEGPLLTFDDPQLAPIIAHYQDLLQQAGQEIVQYAAIQPTTQCQLEEPLIPYDVYLQEHNKMVAEW